MAYCCRMARRKEVRQRKTFRVVAKNEAEQAAAEAAIRAVREAKSRLKAAQDPESSLKAYREVFSDFDSMARDAIEAAEDDEEPDSVEKDDTLWRAVLQSEQTYRCTRGEIRVRRKLYRAQRNGPTRCFFEEKRGVLPGNFLPDLGRVVVEAVAEMPAERASKLLEAALGHPLSTATMKRTTTAVGMALQDEEPAFFEQVLRFRPAPASAKALVISVDGLSLYLRTETWKQAAVATLSFLDGKGRRIETIRLAEMPEEGKGTLWRRLQREVAAIVEQRPDLKLEVIIDGARDLRLKLQELFPNAIHLTDFFHVTEHLAAALWALYPRASDAAPRETLWDWLRQLLRRRDDGAESVCRILEQRALQADTGGRKWAKSEFATHLAYLKSQSPFMSYAKARRAHLSIGSGVVEAACKTLVTQRLKVSGAQWTRPGAGAVLHLRALSQSDRLNDAFIHHAARVAA